MTKKRQIVFDTETTGLSPKFGHRVVDLGAVELIDGKRTGRTLQFYLNPRRDSDPKAFEVHGLTREFLSDKPDFSQIADEFIQFVSGAEVIAHNAKFDVSFLDAELESCHKEPLWKHVEKITDTVAMARTIIKGSVSLDVLCERYGIVVDREKHGALLDSEILVDVLGKLIEEADNGKVTADEPKIEWTAKTKVVYATDSDKDEHLRILKSIRE